MSLSKEQQAALKEHLSGMFCRAKFEIDGRVVDVDRQRESESRTVLVVFIDGSLSGKNLGPITEDTDELATRVYRHRTIARWSAKKIKEIEKIYGKRRAKKEFPKLHERLTYLDCSFKTSSTLVRQFAKLEGIKLLELGGKPV